MKEETKRTTITLSRREFEEIRKFCEKTGRSISALLRIGAKLVITKERGDYDVESK